MVRKWYEVSCNQCGCAEHFPVGRSYKAQAREYGWLISKHGDFCNAECLNKYKKNNKK